MSATEQIFLGRQPIIDRQQAVVGYELLFRATEANHAELNNAKAATADVVCKAFAELGLAHALGHQRAFINVDEEFLCADDAVKLLPRDTVVLEINAEDELGEGLAERCQTLHESGFEFSLTRFHSMSANVARLLPIVSYAKVDIRNQDAASLSKILAPLKGLPLNLIASHVESVEELQLCERAGFNQFQGYYFAHPVLIAGRKLDSSVQNLIKLINLLNTDAETTQLELAFKAEPALVMNLLRLTNSVGMGLAMRVTSVRQAITVMGRNQLRRWLQLLLFSRTSNDAPIQNNPLMQLAALRGYFLELLAQRCYPARKELFEMGFITGLMSVMPAALGIPIEQIINEIAVSEEVSLALLKNEGPLGQLLELVLRYDDNDVDGANNLLSKMGNRLGQQTLNLCLTEAIAWVLNLGSEAA